mmetsp:Transcript_3379/g.11205  ORF Transcript_3379/g.11205 Transcript_3379/m.11205 type:complete len:277 (+) Transcript_3379:284-1114(+)
MPACLVDTAHAQNIHSYSSMRCAYRAMRVGSRARGACSGIACSGWHTHCPDCTRGPRPDLLGGKGAGRWAVVNIAQKRVGARKRSRRCGRMSARTRPRLVWAPGRGRCRGRGSMGPFTGPARGRTGLGSRPPGHGLGPHSRPRARSCPGPAPPRPGRCLGPPRRPPLPGPGPGRRASGGSRQGPRARRSVPPPPRPRPGRGAWRPTRRTGRGATRGGWRRAPPLPRGRERRPRPRRARWRGQARPRARGLLRTPPGFRRGRAPRPRRRPRGRPGSS